MFIQGVAIVAAMAADVADRRSIGKAVTARRMGRRRR